ncbi:cell cycle checkpoint protein RAD17 [Acrasis kona]|uniref:Cell cycle checkpoint protein RAD17 n=1 Tax=Acrasis kona TaxID=1008807 RepID=A0AAW2YKX2_9EUKA
MSGWHKKPTSRRKVVGDTDEEIEVNIKKKPKKKAVKKPLKLRPSQDTDIDFNHSSQSSQALTQSDDESPIKKNELIVVDDDSPNDFSEISRNKPLVKRKTKTTPKQKNKQTKTNPTDNKLWCNKYSPRLGQDIKVHQNKVKAVSAWINASVQGNNDGQILLLVGPPGAGKATMIDVLLQNYNVIKYQHDVQSDEWGERNKGYQSRMSHFREFMSQATRYSLLSLTSKEAPRSNQTFVVIDELPFAKPKSAQHNERHDILTHFLTRHNAARSPLIIIHHTFKSSTVHADIWANYPKGFVNSHQVTKIDINPMTTACIKKILTNVYEKEKISRSIIEAISASADGDLRHAIQQLQFVCLPSSFKPKPKKVKSTKMFKKSDDDEDDECDDDDDTSRDTFIDLFHATGRVLHGKRNPDGTLERNLERDVLDKIHAQEDAQVNYLFQNYLNFMGEDMDALQKCSDSMSMADTFAQPGEDVNDRRFYLYSFLISNKGYQHHNKNNTLRSRFQSITAPKIRSVEIEKSSKSSQLLNCLDHDFYADHGHHRDAFMGNVVPFIGLINPRHPISDILTKYKKGKLDLGDDSCDLNVRDQAEMDDEDEAVSKPQATDNDTVEADVGIGDNDEDVNNPQATDNVIIEGDIGIGDNFDDIDDFDDEKTSENPNVPEDEIEILIDDEDITFDDEDVAFDDEDITFDDFDEIEFLE